MTTAIPVAAIPVAVVSLLGRGGGIRERNAEVLADIDLNPDGTGERETGNRNQEGPSSRRHRGARLSPVARRPCNEIWQPRTGNASVKYNH